MSGPHPSHKIRFSDGVHDYVCDNCGAADTLGGWGGLVYQCSEPPKSVVDEAARLAQLMKDAAREP
jgi:hypothetical protein